MRYVIDGLFYTQPVTGIQRYARELVAELDKVAPAGLFEIAVPKGTENPRLDNIPTCEIGECSGLLWEQLSFAHYLNVSGRTGICLCNTLPLRRKGDIAVVHDVSYKVNPWFFKGPRGLMSRVWHCANYRHAARSALRIVTVSSFSRGEIARSYHVDQTTIAVCPNGWQHLQKCGSDSDALSARGLETGEFFFSMSSLAPNKNVQWLLKVAELMPESVFVIAGGSQISQKFSDVPKNVRLVGYVSDEEAKALMEGCKAFVFPTFYEGFGIPPLEALACGANVVVSDTPCMHEVFGESATYVDPNDPLPIDLVESSSDARDETLEKYSWETTADSFMRMLMQIETTSK